MAIKIYSVNNIITNTHYRNFTIVLNKFLQIGLSLDLEGQNQRARLDLQAEVH